MLAAMEFKLFGSLGTADFYASHGVEIQPLEWLHDSNEDFNIQNQLVDGQFDLVVNLPMRSKYVQDLRQRTRPHNALLPLDTAMRCQ